MKSTRLFRNFIFLFSLLGLGGFAWGERYETLFVQTQNTPHMTEAEWKHEFSCVSSQYFLGKVKLPCFYLGAR